MDLLERVLGSPEKRTEYQDFIDRYDAAPPYDTIEDREAVDRYGQVTPSHTRPVPRFRGGRVRQALPDRAEEFSRWLRTRATEKGVSVPDYDLNDDGIDDRAQHDPGELAEVTTRVREQAPNIFEQILGKGGTGGRFDNPIVKMAVAGIAAMAASRLMGARR